MMDTILRIVLGLVLLFQLGSIQAQVALPEQVLKELDKREITEDEFRNRLMERGINYENLSREQLFLLKPEIESIVEEIESEKSEFLNNKDSIQKSYVTQNEVETKIKNNAVSITGKQEALVRRKRNSVDSNEIYGHSVLKNGDISIFRASDEIEAPDNYILGAGDELAISIFGQSQLDLLLKVDSKGFIKPTGIAKILVGGKTLEKARILVKSRLSQYYIFNTEQYSLNVNGSRTIRINIFGEVAQSGTYSLSGFNSAINAIVAAGGPTPTGSVRKIEKERRGRREKIDLYKYLNGSLESESALNLQSGDNIFVPVANKTVVIKGGVRRPMHYELLKDEGIIELLNFAGGLTSKGRAGDIVISRQSNGETVIINIEIDKITSGQNYAINDGDVISIREIENPDNVNVEILGSIELPGKYEFKTESTLLKLVRKANLKFDARTDLIFLQRTKKNGESTLLEINLAKIISGTDPDISLHNLDVIRILSSRAYNNDATIAVTGAVKNQLSSISFPSDSTLTLKGALTLAGGLSPNASTKGIIFRNIQENSKETLYQLIDFGTESEDIRLNPFDSLIIFPRELYTDAFPIEVRGAVRRPGVYRYNSSLGFKEVFALAGGFSIDAATNRVDIFKLKFGNNMTTETTIESVELNSEFEIIEGNDSTLLSPFDIIVVRSVPEFELITTVSIQGEVRYPGSYALTDENRKIFDVLSKAGGITNEAFANGATLYRNEGNFGYVIVELDKIVKNPSSPENIVLLAGDILSIPKAQELVTIRTLGTKAQRKYNDEITSDGTISIAYKGPKSSKWYIKNYAGGFNKRSKRSTLSMKDPSGRLKGTKRFLGIKLYPRVTPGSTIALEMKQPKKEKPPKESVDWASISTAIMTGLTATLTTILLIDRI